MNRVCKIRVSELALRNGLNNFLSQIGSVALLSHFESVKIVDDFLDELGNFKQKTSYTFNFYTLQSARVKQHYHYYQSQKLSMWFVHDPYYIFTKLLFSGIN